MDLLAAEYKSDNPDIISPINEAFGIFTGSNVKDSHGGIRDTPA
tara:strand:- start:691 stop:822 length:132 start_codon:yes stop_codon:yes gene_type:complete